MYFKFPFSAVREKIKKACNYKERIPHSLCGELWNMSSNHFPPCMYWNSPWGSCSVKEDDLLPVRVPTKLSPAVRRGSVPELFCCIKGMMENLLPWVCHQVKSLIKDDCRECLFLPLFARVLWHLQRGRQKSLPTPTWPCSWHLAHSIGLCPKQSEMEILCQWSLWTPLEELKFELQVQVLSFIYFYFKETYTFCFIFIYKKCANMYERKSN